MKVLILGIGNILFGDEGIGPHMITYLKRKYRFFHPEHSVDLIDGGTLATKLIPLIVTYDRVLIIDTVSVDSAKIGDIYFFDFKDAPKGVTWSGSAHEVEMLQTLTMIELADELPPVKILGIVPYVIGEETTFKLSTEVKKRVGVLEKVVLDYLESLGFGWSKEAEIDIDDVVELTYLEGVR